MKEQFARFCEQHKISSTYKNDTQLNLLKTWCKEYVSSDREYDGSIQGQYNHYWQLVQDFLTNVSDSKQALSIRIAHAVERGYDRFLTQELITRDLINSTSPSGSGATFLHIAAWKGHIATAKALLAKGADPCLTQKDGQLPIHYALTFTLFSQDLQNKKVKIFELLRDHSPNTLEAQDDNGDTVAHKMALYNFLQQLNYLMEEKSPLILSMNKMGQYPIHIAILHKKIEVVRLLIADKEEANLIDYHSQTPLHYAARYGNREMTILCAQCAQDIDARDSSQQTPLMLAVKHGNLVAAEVLINQGADLGFDYEHSSEAMKALITTHQSRAARIP